MVLTYLVKNYNITLEHLKDLSISEIEQLIIRHPYKMGILMKHNKTLTYFGGRMWSSRSQDCYDCGRDLWEDGLYEIQGYENLEFICTKCYNNRQDKKLLGGIMGELH